MNLARINESYEIREERLGFVPENFKRSVATVSTASEIETIPVAWRSSTVTTPIWRFPSARIIVLSSQPVSVKIRKGETLFFAESENLGIFATGSSGDEAIHAFCEQLVHFYKHYKRLSWDRVTGEAHRLKNLYEKLFREDRL